jgi:hypothetical protein
MTPAFLLLLLLSVIIIFGLRRWFGFCFALSACAYLGLRLVFLVFLALLFIRVLRVVIAL